MSSFVRSYAFISCYCCMIKHISMSEADYNRIKKKGQTRSGYRFRLSYALPATSFRCTKKFREASMADVDVFGWRDPRRLFLLRQQYSGEDLMAEATTKQDAGRSKRQK